MHRWDERPGPLHTTDLQRIADDPRLVSAVRDTTPSPER